jgi:branched-chain amino acid transport system ATP-binding protein
MTVLSARGITVRFGGVQALTGVDLDVAAGEVVGLIGPNGAGKTTFIDAVSGFVPASGRVELDGRDLSRLPPHRRARRGLARTWQSGELFEELSVRENLAVASRSATVEPTLALLGLGLVADAAPRNLSEGQRKLVGVGRALAAGPRLVCLDEPAAGLDPGERSDLGRRLRDVATAGTALLLVDHDMGLVLGVCDRVVVLEFGAVIATGAPQEVRADPRVTAAYLGSSA